MHDKSKSKLSSNVLQMKFMKKSKEKCEKEAEENERKLLFDSEIPAALIKESDMCVMEGSFVPCLELINSRLSYKGMNPEIEKLMRTAEQEDPEKLGKMDGVSDEEMAQRYTTLVGSMRRKFMSKRKWAAEKKSDSENEEDDEVICYSTPQASSNPPRKFRKPRD